jgi:hypothetical protein
MDLGFTVSIETDKDERDLVELICLECDGAKKDRGYIKFMGNILKFENNFDYDSNKVNEKDGWQYYKYELDGSPYEDITADNQQVLISTLCQCLRKAGALTKSFSELDGNE